MVLTSCENQDPFFSGCETQHSQVVDFFQGRGSEVDLWLAAQQSGFRCENRISNICHVLWFWRNALFTSLAEILASHETARN
jgi:hypothetical protein